MDLADPVQTNQALMVFWKPLRNIIPVTTLDFEVVGYRASGPVDRAGCERAIAETQQSLKPATRAEITQAYVFLQANCSLSKDRAAESKAAKDLRHAAMIDGLMEYPKDLVLHALRTWHKTSQWVPVASEVIQKIQRETDVRKSLLTCLRGASYRGEKGKSESKGRGWNDYTDEEKAAHEERSAKLVAMLRGAGNRL